MTIRVPRIRRTLVLLCWLVVGILSGLSNPSLQAADPLTIRSRSGQFMIRGFSLIGSPKPTPEVHSDRTYAQVDPALLAVSCEEIKNQLLTTLRMEDDWKGQIMVSLRPVTRNEEPVLVKVVRFAGRWQYRLSVPETVQTRRLVKALVRVLLLEIANRGAPDRIVEMPLWLAEGLTEKLLAEQEHPLMLEHDSAIIGTRRNRDPMRAVRQFLLVHPPLTLEELNWPTEEQLSGEDLLVYEHCSHLMVTELLNLRQGETKIRTMLADLSQYLNWQTSFLKAFGDHFQRMIDLDKWWSLIVVENTGRDLTYTWSTEESWQKLEEILTTAVKVRIGNKEMPMPARTSVQNIIREWEYRKQIPVLTLKLNHLHALRMRISQDMIKLVDRYRQTLQAYLQNRRDPVKHHAHQLRRENMTLKIHVIKQRTVTQLDTLDAERQSLRRKMDQATATGVRSPESGGQNP